MSFMVSAYLHGLPSLPCVAAVMCFMTYFIVGFFGAARWGTATDGNLLVNAWGPPAYHATLNILLGGASRNHFLATDNALQVRVLVQMAMWCGLEDYFKIKQ